MIRQVQPCGYQFRGNPQSASSPTPAVSPPAATSVADLRLAASARAEAAETRDRQLAEAAATLEERERPHRKAARAHVEALTAWKTDIGRQLSLRQVPHEREIAYSTSNHYRNKRGKEIWEHQREKVHVSGWLITDSEINMSVGHFDGVPQDVKARRGLLLDPNGVITGFAVPGEGKRLRRHLDLWARESITQYAATVDFREVDARVSEAEWNNVDSFFLCSSACYASPHPKVTQLEQDLGAMARRFGLV